MEQETTTAKEHTQYPSRYAHGETVVLNIHGHTTIPGCIVERVIFDEAKVRYDLKVPLMLDTEIGTDLVYTIFREVDSICVEDAQ